MQSCLTLIAVVGVSFPVLGNTTYWLNTVTVDPELRIKGQENAYINAVKGAVGGAAGVTHAADKTHTDCEPNANVEALRIGLDALGIESRPLWKPMHRQPVYADCPAKMQAETEIPPAPSLKESAGFLFAI